MAEVTISDAGAHPDAVGVKIPAMRGGQKGYVTDVQIAALVDGGGGGDMTAEEILSALLTVDGASSGLDADLVDGQHASALLARTNHTGAQAISTVTGLQTALDGKAASSHTHDDRYYTESEIDSALSGKSNTGHTHAFSAISDKPTTLSGYGITDAATSTQGGKADTALQPSGNLAGLYSVTTARTNLKILVLDQTAYDALDPPDADTIYLIEED